MSTIQEIEVAIQNLSNDDLAAFRRWFAEYDAPRWDLQFEVDAAGGKLDNLAAEAISDFREGRCRDL